MTPDRFADGDPANDAGVDRQNPGAWHGGDLKGLSGRLDYVKALGATALWMTPVYRQVGPVNGTAGDHGYWPADFRSIDPHFGRLSDFTALNAKAHTLGLKVMLDQVINHYSNEAAAQTAHPAARCRTRR
ncbi:alpha-amylase family glycosyl hydrolase [Deinococcus sp.]|uniref:alpha-amylase family glycosyl hydrolase n=1 Tax=Deinococcus sp. TaxID=47478 RepID=UPI003C7BC561